MGNKSVLTGCCIVDMFPFLCALDVVDPRSVLPPSRINIFQISFTVQLKFAIIFDPFAIFQPLANQ